MRLDSKFCNDIIASSTILFTFKGFSGFLQNNLRHSHRVIQEAMLTRKIYFAVLSSWLATSFPDPASGSSLLEIFCVLVGLRCPLATKMNPESNFETGPNQLYDATLSYRRTYGRCSSIWRRIKSDHWRGLRQTLAVVVANIQYSFNVLVYVSQQMQSLPVRAPGTPLEFAGAST